jgi:ribosomal protein L11 methyltransferase
MNRKQQKWLALAVTAAFDSAEAVEYALNTLDASGTEIIYPAKRTGETVEIVGYFEEKSADEIVGAVLVDALRIYDFSADSIKKFEWRAVENQDWLAEWKKHWRPTETAKFIVAPAWSEIEATAKIIVRIEPSMAFGTGTHETTRLCLRAIEENFEPEMSFLDVGTGTGILAIAASKLAAERAEIFEKSQENVSKISARSAAEILACDTDFEAIEIARQNAAINGAGEIEFFAGSITAETPEFDFVCANLTADVIAPLLPLFTAKTKRILVLSGILKEQKDFIISELKKFQIENPKIETDGEWISIQLRNEK